MMVPRQVWAGDDYLKPERRRRRIHQAGVRPLAAHPVRAFKWRPSPEPGGALFTAAVAGLARESMAPCNASSARAQATADVATMGDR